MGFFLLIPSDCGAKVKALTFCGVPPDCTAQAEWQPLPSNFRDRQDGEDQGIEKCTFPVTLCLFSELITFLRASKWDKNILWWTPTAPHEL